MKFINPTVHGYLDYLYVLTFVAAPTVLGLTGMAAMLSYIMAAAVLGLSLLTQYPLGLVKKIPFTVHGGIELVAALATIGSPWLFGFSDVVDARNFFIAAGVLLVGVFLTTDYKAAASFLESQPFETKPKERIMR